MANDSEEHTALQLLAATRHPIGDEIVQRLDMAAKLYNWVRGMVLALIGLGIFIGVMQYKIGKIDDHSSQIQTLRENQDNIRIDVRDLKNFKVDIDQRKNNFDVNFVPKAANWDQTAIEWRAFSVGAESDLTHLRQLWWMRAHDVGPSPHE